MCRDICDFRIIVARRGGKAKRSTSGLYATNVGAGGRVIRAWHEPRTWSGEIRAGAARGLKSIEIVSPSDAPSGKPDNSARNQQQPNLKKSIFFTIATPSQELVPQPGPLGKGGLQTGSGDNVPAYPAD